MTAINIAVERRSAAFILTDSVAYRANGKFAGHCAKVRTYPHARAVFGGRGMIDVLQWLMNGLDLCNDFDEMAGALPGLCRSNKNYALLRSCLRATGKVPLFSQERITNAAAVELFLVGFSEFRQRLVAYCFSSETPNPFYAEQRDIFIGPFLPEGIAESLVPPRTMPLTKRLDAWPTALLEVMEEQRKVSAIRPGGEHIGGAAVLTTLTERGLRQEVVHRWPDPRLQAAHA